MGATSFTGVGQGDSNGKFKPENNCGCGCAPKDEEEKVPPKKQGCFVRHVSGGVKRIVSGGSTKIRVCT